MSDISVSRVVKTTTDDKDSYDVLLKGQMRLNHQTDGSFDEIYEDNPEMIQAIRLHKHGYDFWGPRMQIYGCEADE